MNRLNPRNWSLSIKIILVMLSMAAILLGTTTLRGVTSLRDANYNIIENTVRQTGETTINKINEQINRAFDQVSSFLSNPIYKSQVADFFTNPVPEERDTNLDQILNNTILLFGADTLDGIRLLDLDGKLLSSQVNNTSGVFTDLITSLDQSRTDSYREGRILAQTRRSGSSLLSIVKDGIVDLESVHVVVNEGGLVIGYVITNYNMSTLIRNQLIQTSPLALHNYMVFSVVNVVALRTTQESEHPVSIISEGVSSARRGETGLKLYKSKNSAGREIDVLGFYAPLILRNGTEIAAFVSEVDLNLALPLGASAVGYIDFFSLTQNIIVIAIFIGIMLLLIVPSARKLRRGLRALAAGDFNYQISTENRLDELGDSINSLVYAREQVQTMTEEINQQLEIRTQDMITTQEIIRASTSTLDLDLMMSQVVNLIIERFAAIYQAQIFIVNNFTGYAELRSSTGEAGKKLLERGHRLAVGSTSIIGQTTEQGRYIIARDTAISNVHRPNELLPDTRTELAIPLRIGARVIGALDIQSKQRDAFNNNDITTLQIMADQIAIAIENARLYAQIQSQIEDVERTAQGQTLDRWLDHMRASREKEIYSQFGQETPTDFSTLRQQVYLTTNTAIGKLTRNRTVPIAVPIKLRGQVLGIVDFELPDKDYNQQQVLLAEELVNRLAVSIENARLFEQSQRAVDRERIVNEISTKISAQPDISHILSTAIQEVGRALRTPQVSVRLSLSSDAPLIIEPADELEVEG